MAQCHLIVTHPYAEQFIKEKARKLCKSRIDGVSDYPDLMQQMRVYLLTKAHLYDPKRGSPQAFINKVVRSWVNAHVRHKQRHKRRGDYRAQSLERTYVQTSEETVPLAAALLEENGRRHLQVYPMPSLERVELRDELDHLLGKLNRDDRRLLLLVAKSNIASAARTLGVTRSYANHAMARIRNRLKNIADAMESSVTSSANGIKEE